MQIVTELYDSNFFPVVISGGNYFELCGLIINPSREIRMAYLRIVI
jgi:hypothetical protein